MDDVGPAAHVLQYLDLTFNLLLLHGLEDLYDAFGIVRDVHTLKYLGVLSPTDLAYDLVILLVAPIDGEGLVVPVIPGTVDVDVGIDSVNGRGGEGQ